MSKDPVELCEIFFLSGRWNTMEAAQVQGQVKRAWNAMQQGCIFDQQLYLDSCLACLSPGDPDGTRCKIDAGHVPARTGECNHVGACAAANINGATGFMLLYEFEQLRRADACIPGRLAEIPGLKLKAAEQILHFSLERGSQMSLRGCEASHFDNSIEFFYNHTATIKKHP